jgi:hypothetical protein
MFDQYIKLFHLGWIELWMVEAVCIIGVAIVLVVLVRKFADMIGE